MPTSDNPAPVWIRARYIGPGQHGRAHCKIGNTSLQVRWDRVAWEHSAQQKRAKWRELRDVARELHRLALASGVTLSQVLQIVLREDGEK